MRGNFKNKGKNMQTFIVGGAVRDILMGRKPKDYDYVVVGSTPEEMLALGYTKVGSDFPVFLHPETKAEYALARTERKSGNGYKGFVVHASPDVTLEEDLGRRDLTINAMAVDDSDHIVDPFNGQDDVRNKVLRHVRAESFIEDPVRVLRLARFAARYTDFSVAPETMALCQQMVAAGELNHLVAERVWQEVAKGLMEREPSRMFETLRACGALAVLLPELDCLAGVPQPAAHHPEVDTFVHVMMVVDLAAEREEALEVRFAALMHDLGKGVTAPELWPAHVDHDAAGVPLVDALCRRLRVPSACRDLAAAMSREHTLVHRAGVLKATSMIHLFKRVDAFRRPERFESLLRACECDARGRLGFKDREYPQADMLRTALAAAKSVDAGALAKVCKEPKHIPERLHGERTRKVKAALTHL
jgi:tRNA nucleotidyltransferase (CCA-adding enzyme)